MKGIQIQEKYAALRTIATIYKVIGVIAAVLTILAVIGICLTSVMGGALFDSITRDMGVNGPMMRGTAGGILGGLIGSLFVLLNGGGLALTFFALGEGISVLLAMEENTRETAYLLRGGREAAPPAVES